MISFSPQSTERYITGISGKLCSSKTSSIILMCHELEYTTVYGIFDCTFKCLSNPSCLSLNLATSKGADKKLWCELLSSTKHKKPEEFWGNESAHHFSIQVGWFAFKGDEENVRSVLQP